MDCVVSADPVGEVTWFKSNIPVTLDTRVMALVDHDKHSLIIRNVRISDFGIYKCKAVNDLGAAEIEIQLSGNLSDKNYLLTIDFGIYGFTTHFIHWDHWSLHL